MTGWRLCVAIAAVLGGHPAAAMDIPADQRRSGSEFMSEATRAMQDDDLSNPGMLGVLDGARLWQEPAGASARSCASCHGDAAESMSGVGARYPAIDEASGRPIDLAGRIGQCRQERQGAEAFARESPDIVALTAHVGNQSRGHPITPPADLRLTPFREEGRRLFETRMGQLDLSCASCHDNNWDKRLGGSPITQAHPTGYPLYRLEWQSIGSLQRRMRNCMIGVRAEPYAFGSQEFIALELYLNTRAAGMALETPGVRP